MRTDNLVIGIGGLKGSGKDTLATFFAEDLLEITGTATAVIGMSDVLRDAIYAINPWIVIGVTDHEAFMPNVDPQVMKYRGVLTELKHNKGLSDDDAYTEAKKLPEVRNFLQKLGTEVGRDLIDQNVWVNVARKRIDELRDHGFHVIVTGIRFPNELKMIQEYGTSGKTVYVSRPGITFDGHSSEEALRPTDFAFGASNSYGEDFLQDTVSKALLSHMIEWE